MEEIEGQVTARRATAARSLSTPRSRLPESQPIIVVAPRPWSPPAAILPALGIVLLAGGLMVYRALGVTDWQGLLTESRLHLHAQEDLSTRNWHNPGPVALAATAPVPAHPPLVRLEAPSATEPAPPAPAASPLPPALEPPRAEAREEEPSGPLPPPSESPDEAVASAKAEADQAPAVDDTAAKTKGALDEIAQEAARRQAEREAMERLRARAETEAPPPPPVQSWPRRLNPNPAQVQALARLEALKRRHLEEMDRTLRAWERQQAEWAEQALRELDAPPPGAWGRPRPGLLPPPPPPPFARDAFAGAPPVPLGFDFPEDAQVRTFIAPDGSRGILIQRKFSISRPPR